jgi:His/Glu/Gln/Arg/opine family amino acid ABC transporter permease subunit
VTGRLLTFLRDRKVRDVLWQAAGAIGLVVLVWFFVRNASENMVKAGIASGFQFLWRDSGIEVPFNLTGYRPSDTILALLWTGIVNTLLVSAVSIVGGDGDRLHRRACCRLSRNWLLSTLAAAYVEFVRNIPLLFFVLFWYFGVLAALPTPRESLSSSDVAFLNRRGLSIPTPNDVTGLAPGAAGDAILIAGAMGARALGARAPGTHRPRLPDLGGRLRDLRRAAGARPSPRRGHHELGRADPARLQLPRRLRAWCRSSWRCSQRSRLTPRASSPRWCAAASCRCAGPDRRRPRARPDARAASCGWW